MRSRLQATPDATGTIVFTAKRRGVLTAKRFIPIVGGVVVKRRVHLDVEEDDQLFFDYSCFDPDLAPVHRVVEVFDSGPLFEIAPSAFRHSVLQAGLPAALSGLGCRRVQGGPAPRR